MILIGFIFVITAPISAQRKFGEPWNYTMLNGLPTTGIYEMMVDSRGYVWFGSDNGLTKFDGQKFQNFDVEDGLGDNTVLRIFEDKQGRYWFHHLDAAPSYLKNNQFKQLDFKGEDISVDVNSRFVEMDDGTILLGCVEGILKIFPNDSISFSRGAKNLRYCTFSEFNDSVIVHAKIYLNGVSYESVFKEGLVLEDFPYELINCEELVSELTVNQQFNFNAFFRSDNFLKAVFYDKTLDIQLDNRFFETIKVDLVEDTLLYESSINGARIFACRNGQLVLKQTLMEGELISSSVFDLSGGLWLSSLSNGIYHFPASKAKELTIEGSKIVFAKEENGCLYFANRKGELFERKESGYQKILSCPNTENDVILIKDVVWSRNELTVMTNYGVYVLNKQTGDFRSCVVGNGTHGMGHAIQKDQDIVFTGINGLVTFNGYDLQYPFQGQRNLFRVYDLAYHSKRLFIASISGLYSLDGYRIKKVRPNRFDKKRINAVQDVNGYLMVGTAKDGLYAYKKKQEFVLNRKNGLLSDNVSLIAPSSKNKFWVLTSNGIQLFEIRDGTFVELKRLDIKSLVGTLDILGITEFNNELILSSYGGTFVFDLDSIQQLERMPLLLESFTVDKQRLQLTGSAIELKEGTENIQLLFSVLNFSKYPTNFHYKINEGSWRISQEGVLNLSALSPGDYTIQAYASSMFYLDSPIQTYRFSIPTPYYQNIWFIVFLASVALAIITWWVAWRLNVQHSRKKRLMRMELQALQSQMNPHFTFNTMNSIQNFILKNETRASLDYLSRFGQLMRMILEQSRLQVISLQEELKFLKLYISLEQLRMEQSFELEIGLPDDINIESIGVPSMLFQPFVENAIWHGLGNIDYPGKLRVDFEQREDALVCWIRDNGVGRKKAEQFKRNRRGHKSRGAGISEDRMRIFQDLYGERIHLEIKDGFLDQSVGTTVEIILPLLKVQV